MTAPPRSPPDPSGDTPAASSVVADGLSDAGSGRSRLRRYASTSGALIAGAGAPWALLQAADGSSVPTWRWAATVLATVLLVSAGAALPRRSLVGRIAASGAGFAGLVLGADRLIGDPTLALLALVSTTLALALVWDVGGRAPRRGQVRRVPLRDGQMAGAGIAAVAAWILAALSGPGSAWSSPVVVGVPAVIAAALAVEQAVARMRAGRWRSGVGLAIAVVGAASFAVVHDESTLLRAAPLAAVALAATILVRRGRARELGQRSGWDVVLGHPQRLFVGTFAGLCATGTVLLSIPQSAASGERLSFLDAVFTSTSAVCVTGLVVRDTATELSVFGQVVVLLLIQVGGLGIMTLSTTALWAFRRRLSLRHEAAVASLISPGERGQVFVMAKNILWLTLAVEALGAAVLTAAFVAEGEPLGEAAWRGVFTAVSAFCNAGFSLQTASLVPFQEAPAVLHTVAVLIVVGGLSPVVVFALPGLLRRAAGPVTAQVRLCLVATGVLLVTSFLFFAAFEWNGSLAELGLVDRLNNAWFQAVTLRTAGFNSVDVAAVGPATLTLMMVWMIIGGCPGSTAGGVKTTTVAVLVLSLFRAIRGEWTVDVFGKRVPDRTRAKAALIVVVALVSGVVALVALQLTQDMTTRVALFEVVSALGTVGLSIGGTAELDGIGRIVIVACMFTGRVGGVTLLMFLSSDRGQRVVRRPEEEVDVG